MLTKSVSDSASPKTPFPYPLSNKQENRNEKPNPNPPRPWTVWKPPSPKSSLGFPSNSTKNRRIRRTPQLILPPLRPSRRHQHRCRPNPPTRTSPLQISLQLLESTLRPLLRSLPRSRHRRRPLPTATGSPTKLPSTESSTLWKNTSTKPSHSTRVVR